MELNREQIIKALECFHQRILNTNLAEKITETEMMAVLDALALIKELTLELEAMRTAANSYKMHNEKLTEENERLHASYTKLTRNLHETYTQVC